MDNVYLNFLDSFECCFHSYHLLKSAGREVVDFLQNICSNDIDCPIGHVIHTGMQNHKGGYENDCSVVQLEPNKFAQIFAFFLEILRV